MKLKKPNFKDLIFLVVVVLLLIPQTRKPIQVFLNRGLALFSPSVSNDSERESLSSYNWQLKGEKDDVFDFKTTKGKVVLINFWATWCPPCIAEMSSLQELYNDYNGQIEFLFITDDSFEVVNAFLNKNDYTFPVYTAISEAPKNFNVKSIPRTFLIDKEGNIVIDKTGAANWNSDTVRTTIDKLIKPKLN
ncbi:TlpA family protein disulfide reductase [Seonamhaeicola marinus]|uniref:TlpA family protein disulfide reductase n=1 Tax=Seonamhaeicola marinus TaxID=1912246 RepID=A0A5D0H7F4_9FLAO|nr:TlpA disulfide reductase family protein [Seonamhaeicola marinus]TYA65957.1 TlpA family protein disulfide reductase [Seonamhaeicola marinus]